MNYDNLTKAKKLLLQTDNTCVLCNDEVVLTDKRRGVRPLLDLLESNTDISGFSVADKVVGKAAAFLYCLLNIKKLYTPVISQPALDVLQNAHIPVEYDVIVSAIQNRTKDGFCPMEQAVWNITEPHDAHMAICEALKALTK